MTNYIANSSGVNIGKGIVAALMEAGLSNADIKKSLLMGGSVAISSLIPAYGPSGMWGSQSEVYIAEPIAAGILFALSEYLAGNREKMLKNFTRGFIVGAASAGTYGALYSATLAPARVPSMYSSNAGGLRSATVVPKSAPSFIVS